MLILKILSSCQEFLLGFSGRLLAPTPTAFTQSFTGVGYRDVVKIKAGVQDSPTKGKE